MKNSYRHLTAEERAAIMIEHTKETITTRSSINADVIEITNETSQRERTNQTAEMTVAGVNRDVSSDGDSSGALANNFDTKIPLLYG